MSIGAEKRANILPMEEPKGIGFLGPDYSYDDELIRPAQVGVRRNDTISSVFGAVKGVAYYMDTIAFGESSTGLTSGLPFKKYGTNYFIKTGAKCSNGADMWHYMELIPKGDAFGNNVNLAMSEIGMASLKGLAPGAIEDVKGAINVGPALKSIFGSGYPKCKKVILPVGAENRQIYAWTKDNKGNITGVDTNKPWVDDPGAVFNCKRAPNGEWWPTGGYTWPTTWGESEERTCQTKWVLDKMVGKKEWDAEQKTLNPDGTPATQKFTKESFTDFEGIPNKWLLIALLGITVANFWAYSRRR